jgi:signal recognition particle subunit SRP54
MRIEPSRPPGDAPCPYCGHLLWFGADEQIREVLARITQGRRPPGLSEPREGREEAVREPFTLNEFRKMLDQLKRLGPLEQVISLLPGTGAMRDLVNEAELKRVGGIIDAMTPAERASPEILTDRKRLERIASGAGVTCAEVASLVAQFTAMRDFMSQMRRRRLA